MTAPCIGCDAEADGDASWEPYLEPVLVAGKGSVGPRAACPGGNAFPGLSRSLCDISVPPVLQSGAKIKEIVTPLEI